LTRLRSFPKRTYGSLNELFSDIKAILSNREHVRRAMRGNLVSPEFRERLMLVVTQVNDCRYCSSYHSSEALKVGISADEISLLMQGGIPDSAPASELAAIHYARHWAENNTKSTDVEKKRLIEIYGQETADAIHILLRMIRIGNLSGNTWDSWLYRLTFGRWGLPKSQSPRI
jgi:AhpD family alkylhydroperoxidase